MRYQDVFLGSKEEFGEFIRRAVPELFAGTLVVEGQQIAMPADADIDFKIKFDDEVEGGSITIKASWDKEVEDEAEDAAQDD